MFLEAQRVGDGGEQGEKKMKWLILILSPLPGSAAHPLQWGHEGAGASALGDMVQVHW